MLSAAIALCLRHRALVAAVALAVAIAGALAAARTPVDVLPDLDRPTVTILTEVHGLSAEDVERRVTKPLEDALRGLPRSVRLRTISGRGFSLAFVEFEWGSDVAADRRAVEERLRASAAALPPGAVPRMAPVASIMGQVQFVGVASASGGTDPTALRALADDRVLPRLRALEGVAQVLAIGGAPRELQVAVDPTRLRDRGATRLEVERAVRGAAPESAAVAEAPLAGGARVGDVAEVGVAPTPAPLGLAGVNGRPGVVLVVFKTPGTDTAALTRRVDAAVAEVAADLAPTHPDVRLAPDLFRQAVFIERSVSNVRNAILHGSLLVLAVLLLFLANVRTTVISLAAIPLSLAVTALVFRAMGLTINTMTLGGLAVAVGALVDDAVVDVENVFRRLRENARAASPAPGLWIVFRASCEVRNPILFGTLLAVIVYVPLFFLSGMEGRLFAPIGLAYILSTLASLVVSLAVTPALCHALLGKAFVARHVEDTAVVRGLKRVVGALIGLGMSQALRVWALVVSLAVVAGVVLATRPRQFLPAFNEGAAQVNLILPAETTLEESDRYGRKLEEVLVGIRGVKSVGRRTGRAEGDEHVDGPNVTEAVVTFDEGAGRRREELIEEMRAAIARELPGPASSVEQPLAHLLSHLLSGVNAQVAVKVYGDDLEVLRRAAADIAGALQPVPGVRDLYAEPHTLVEDVEVRPDERLCAAAGIAPDDVKETVEIALAGETWGEGLPVAVRLRGTGRPDLDAVRDLPVRAAGGALLRVRDVATVSTGRVRTQVLRENGVRRAAVQFNVAGRPIDATVADAARVLAPIRDRLAASGCTLVLSGQFEAQQSAARRIAAFAALALAAMAALLFAHFRSANLALQALLAIPAAVAGGAAAVVVTRQPVSVATLVGLVSLGGIATRNAILLLDHYLHLMRDEGVPFGPDLLLRAGRERMVPVLMTALCTGIGLVPLALAPDQPGRELLYPVATVILGGLASATLFEFLLTPALFWLFGRSPAERLAARRDLSQDALDRFRPWLAPSTTITPTGGPHA
ncbi:MAG: efflux RND transporter permease subunit [Planctomycetia bacterium]|nr:efflux RND transporter permease subunit [Planctomycetia bacterium]